MALNDIINGWFEARREALRERKRISERYWLAKTVMRVVNHLTQRAFQSVLPGSTLTTQRIGNIAEKVTWIDMNDLHHGSYVSYQFTYQLGDEKPTCLSDDEWYRFLGLLIKYGRLESDYKRVSAKVLEELLEDGESITLNPDQQS